MAKVTSTNQATDPIKPEPAAPTSYPEHDKLIFIERNRTAVQAFLDWLLDEAGYTLCRYQEAHVERLGTFTPSDFELVRNPETGKSEPKMVEDTIYDPAGYYPVYERREQLLAAHFEIDLDRLEAEKRAMLDEIRALNAARAEAAK